MPAGSGRRQKSLDASKSSSRRVVSLLNQMGLFWRKVKSFYGQVQQTMKAGADSLLHLPSLNAYPR